MTDAESEKASRSDPDFLLLEDCGLSTSKVGVPEARKGVSLRLDPDVLSYPESSGRGYQTRINAVASAYVEAQARK